MALSSRRAIRNSVRSLLPVRCAKEIDWRLQRNILFLHDYLHAEPESIHGATRERILACVRVVLVISLADLIRKTGRSAQGVRLIKIDDGDRVTSASLVEAASEDEEVEA